ncbi:MAG: hypothetical protein Fur002_16950 [Anaerolineales bacterium]
MKSSFKLYFVLFIATAASLACVTLMGTPIPAAPILPPAATLPPVTEEAAATAAPAAELACPLITQRVMEATLAEGEEELVDETYIVTYLVQGDKISEPTYEDVSADLQDEQDNAELHQQIWDYFTALIPLEQRSALAEYSLTTDGAGGTLAAVSQTWYNRKLWALEVDVADVSDPYSLTFTLIHEFGHLLTLGPEQVPPDKAVFDNPDDNDIYLRAVSQCPRYFPGEGCANADSYINAFYDEFWAELHDEWNEINLEEDEDLYYEKLDDFYNKYKDRFVTDYAATNPEEDMAETWAFFILNPAPAGETIAEEKILFFYQYPELVALREEILNNVCANLSE